MIQEGDFVEIVRWPCCGAGVGLRFVVASIDHPQTVEDRLICSRCRIPHGPDADNTAISVGPRSMRIAAPVPWLRKLPALPESVTEREELRV